MNVDIVVPCYNEQARLSDDAFLSFARQHPDVGFLFVDDGSTDATPLRLCALCHAAPASLRWMALGQHSGKAEAVRRGFLASLSNADVHYVGFWDADLATPLDEIPAFVSAHEEHPHVTLVMGARIPMLGHRVRRAMAQRVAGRIFANAAAATLSVAVHDTQCGAKLFRANDLTRHVFRDPFQTIWIFDVEILARMIRHQQLTHGPSVDEVVYELPLGHWREMPGSKRRIADYVIAARDLFLVRRRYLSAVPAPNGPAGHVSRVKTPRTTADQCSTVATQR